MAIFTKQKVSPRWKLNKKDLKALGMNLIKFSAPTLAIFFGLLAQGVELEKAYPVAVLALYQSLADLFKKLLSNSK